MSDPQLGGLFSLSEADLIFLEPGFFVLLGSFLAKLIVPLPHVGEKVGVSESSTHQKLVLLSGLRLADAADGYPADGLVRPEVVSLLRGPASSSIVLSISRQGFTHNRAVYLERRTMTQPPLKEVCTSLLNFLLTIL